MGNCLSYILDLFNWRDEVQRPLPSCTKKGKQFHLLTCIGEGSYGRVHMSLWKDYNNKLKQFKWKVVAIKSVSKRHVVEKGHCLRIEHERQALIRLRDHSEQHQSNIDVTGTTTTVNNRIRRRKKTNLNLNPFIVELIGSYQDSNHIYFILECCQGGNLSELLDRCQTQNHRRGFSETIARFYLSEVLSALNHIHQHGIIFRDLKSENIVLDQSGHIRLVDFGLAHIGPKFSMLEKNNDKNNQKNKLITYYCTGRTFTLCGSDDYIAPEVLSKNGYDWSCDLWSFGCLVFELMYGFPPFQAQTRAERFLKIITQNSYLTHTQHHIPNNQQQFHQNNSWSMKLNDTNKEEEDDENEIIKQFDQLSYEARDLISKLLMVDPKDRIGTSLYGWKSFYIDQNEHDDNDEFIKDMVGNFIRSSNQQQKSDVHIKKKDRNQSSHMTNNIHDDSDDDDDKIDIEMMKDEKLRLMCGFEELSNHSFWNKNNEILSWEVAQLLKRTPPHIPFPKSIKHNDFMRNKEVASSSKRNRFDHLQKTNKLEDEEEFEQDVLFYGDSSTDARYFSNRFTNQVPELPPLGHPHKGGPTPSFDQFPHMSSISIDDDDDDDDDQHSGGGDEEEKKLIYTG